MQYELLTRRKPCESIKLTTEQGLGISPGLCFTDSFTSLNHGVKLAIQWIWIVVNFLLFNPSDRRVIIVNMWFVTVWMCVCVWFYTSRSRSDCIWWWEENWEWEEETRPAKCRDLNNQNLKINCLLFSFRINFFSSNIPKNEKISNYLALLCSSNSRNRLL